MKKSWIIISSLAIVIIGIIAGISIYDKNKNKERNIIENEINEISELVTDECIEEGEKFNEQWAEEIEANSNEEKISPNALLILKRYYKECNHTINEYIDIPQNLVNKTQGDLIKEYPNWDIQKYSSTEIILYKEFESTCGQHFILRSNNEKIIIYKVNENNEEEIYQETEISTDYLTETDKIEIEKGISVNGVEELNQLIEDFE